MIYRDKGIDLTIKTELPMAFDINIQKWIRTECKSEENEQDRGKYDASCRRT